MRSDGHGGQKVSKVEMAVCAIYAPASYSTVSRNRSQLMNKKRAVERIKLHIMQLGTIAKADDKKAKRGSIILWIAATQPPI